MTDEFMTKGIFGALIAVFSFINGCVSEIIIVLAILMIFDYITGILIAKKNNKFSQQKGVWGAIKKLSYLMIVITGYLADITINHFASIIGLNFITHGALGFAVIFYLIGNEGLSLYENWIKLGLPAPLFLSNLFTNFKIMSNNLVKKNDLSNKRISKEEEDNGEDD